MAILTRRGLIELLDEAPVEPKLLNRHFIPRLNRLDDQSLATEWELVILVLFRESGSGKGEPDLEGSSNVDLRFEAPSGLADVSLMSHIYLMMRRSAQIPYRVLPMRYSAGC